MAFPPTPLLWKSHLPLKVAANALTFFPPVFERQHMFYIFVSVDLVKVLLSFRILSVCGR